MNQPEHIKRWREYEEIKFGDKMFKCPDCNSWFHELDHLAPYHWENCYCSVCKKMLHEMVDFEKAK